MSLSRKRRQRRATLVGAVVGMLIIFTFVLGLIAPDLGTRSRSDDDSGADVDPLATAAPPTPDPNVVFEGGEPYLHSSGYYQTFQPVGGDWSTDEFLFDETAGYLTGSVTYPSVFIRSGRHAVVIHHFRQSGINFDSIESFSAEFLDQARFAGEWQEYDSWAETGRQITDNTVSIDFNLRLQNQEYAARDISRLEASVMYTVRIVVPAANPALLDELEVKVLPAFVPLTDLQTLEQGWPTYVDREQGFAFKHPFGWEQVSGGQGGPVTWRVMNIDAPSNPSPYQPLTAIRLSTATGTHVESPDDARAWVADNLFTGDGDANQTLDALPVTRQQGSGYLVAYTYQTDAGDTNSGLVLLLDDSEGTLYVADLKVELLGGGNLIDPSFTQDLVPVQEAIKAVSDGLVLLPE
ncbi:MAG: hypothetical protein GYB65_12280 [Chloroflexi bacterium]|nr:hypothetical protein [Chloroflexota bacterium]